MQYQTKRFKSLKTALKELKPFIRDGEHLQIGKLFKRFAGLRSRELLANWLLCVAANFMYQSDRLTFTSDPVGSDGIICDTQTEETWQTEHVLVPFTYGAAMEKVETLILKAIEEKEQQRRGGLCLWKGARRLSKCWRWRVVSQ